MMPSALVRLRQAPLSFPEFVAMMAATMAMYALAIDAMLPALPAIGRSFQVTNDNQLQWVIALFVIGGGLGQLFYGPLSDWLGRRPVLLLGLALYVLLAALAAQADSLPHLLALRMAQGLAAGSAGVVPRSIIRDRFEGAEMAKVMSMTFIVFLIVPVLAPTLGQAVLLFLPWQGIFGFLAAYGCAVALWVALRLPETLHPEYRRSPSISHLTQASVTVLREPTSFYYTLASTALIGSLMAYITTMPQIFSVYFKQLALMPGIFALCAGTMALASLFNVRFVQRVGMRGVSHCALIGFVLIAALHLGVSLAGPETLLSFTLLQAATMGCFSLAISNFSAIAMQRMGAIAGSAASVQGVTSMIGGAVIGSLIGHQWRGEITFLPAGTLCGGLAALALVLIAERGRLFREPASGG
jgi:DHA1 family bicyclomycin/chloramphenicol resistance-like MFS transporter